MRRCDCEALEQAVADKIEAQIKFVGWWDANVRDGGRPSK